MSGGTDAGIRVAWGKTRGGAAVDGYLGFNALGATAFSAVPTDVAEYNLSSAGTGGSDYATLVALVGTDAVIGADATIDVEFYVRAVRYASTATGLVGQGFGS